MFLYRKAIDFCMLILQTPTLQNSLIIYSSLRWIWALLLEQYLWDYGQIILSHFTLYRAQTRKSQTPRLMETKWDHIVKHLIFCPTYSRYSILRLRYFIAVHVYFHYFFFNYDYCMRDSLALESKWRELLDHLEWLFRPIHGVHWF